MRISTKGRYGLAAMLSLAQKTAGSSVSDISVELGISKIYLEQVFALLKKAGLIKSQKGAGGGYSLSAPPDSVTVYSVLKATEAALFEPTPASLNLQSQDLESILFERVWIPIDNKLSEFLSSVTLGDILPPGNEQMFYI